MIGGRDDLLLFAWRGRLIFKFFNSSLPHTVFVFASCCIAMALSAILTDFFIFFAFALRTAHGRRLELRIGDGTEDAMKDTIGTPVMETHRMSS